MKEFITCFVVVLVFVFNSFGQYEKNYVVRINAENAEKITHLENLGFDLADTRIKNVFEILVNDIELDKLYDLGFEVEIYEYVEQTLTVDPEYHTYQEVMFLLDSLATAYPTITFLDTIGTSQINGNFIVAIKISDNPDVEEDEPEILYDGLHHAKEAVGMESCLAIINHLLTNYGTDPDVTDWINDNEIWVLPMLNPDGWRYIIEQNVPSPYWRKNLSDNNNNGVFDSNYDGVDLNRNYDFHWSEGGSTNPASSNYRGSSPFSEAETQTKRDFVSQHKFVMSLTYHCSGEIVIYPWDLDGNQAPDHNVILALADSVASRIPKYYESGTYDIGDGNGNGGYSDVWMYGVKGCIEMTVETSRYTAIPAGSVAVQMAQDNVNGAMYLFDRIKGPGLTGHITDAGTGLPLSATIKILEIYHSSLTPRSSDLQFGRYYRLLEPGTYTVEVSKPGYQTVTLSNVVVGAGSLTSLDVQLNVVTGIKNQNDQVAGEKFQLHQNYPNPFNPKTKIEYYIPVAGDVELSVYNSAGQTVETLILKRQNKGDHQVQWDGSSFASGIYYYQLKVGSRYSQIKKMLLIK